MRFLTFTNLEFCLTAITNSPSSDPEDLWDFGTVRNAARPGTIGRAQQNPIQVSGPPLTWENDSTSRSEGSGSSGGSFKSSLTTKGELPPLPTSNNRHSDHQATVRNLPSGGVDPVASGQRTVQREPSDEYDDYDDQYLDAYSNHSRILQEGRGQAPLDDELPDTTMLDSVILPAIASVSYILVLQHPARGHDCSPIQLFPRVSTQEARVALSSLQRAFTEAERIIPGVTMELVNEIVDSVEHVEDDR